MKSADQQRLNLQQVFGQTRNSDDLEKTMQLLQASQFLGPYK